MLVQWVDQSLDRSQQIESGYIKQYIGLISQRIYPEPDLLNYLLFVEIQLLIVLGLCYLQKGRNYYMMLYTSLAQPDPPLKKGGSGETCILLKLFYSNVIKLSNYIISSRCCINTNEIIKKLRSIKIQIEGSLFLLLDHQIVFCSFGKHYC